MKTTLRGLSRSHQPGHHLEGSSQVRHQPQQYCKTFPSLPHQPNTLQRKPNPRNWHRNSHGKRRNSHEKEKFPRGKKKFPRRGEIPAEGRGIPTGGRNSHARGKIPTGKEKFPRARNSHGHTARNIEPALVAALKPTWKIMSRCSKRSFGNQTTRTRTRAQDPRPVPA